MALEWINYQKAYNLVTHSWILETNKLAGMANNAVKLMEKSMRTWNTQVEYSGNHLMCVLNEEYFFITALIPLSVILREAVQGYRFQRGSKVNLLLHVDDLELYGKVKIIWRL